MYRIILTPKSMSPSELLEVLRKRGVEHPAIEVEVTDTTVELITFSAHVADLIDTLHDVSMTIESLGPPSSSLI